MWHQVYPCYSTGARRGFGADGQTRRMDMAASAQVEEGGDFLQIVESHKVCQAHVQVSIRICFKHLDIPMEPVEVFVVGGCWGTRLVTWQDP